MFYRKFFWDFIGGRVLEPTDATKPFSSGGGILPGPGSAPFLAIIVQVPIVQILCMIIAIFLCALEYPLPLLKPFRIYRSWVVRIVLIVAMSFLAALFYQGTNAAIWGLVAVFAYSRAQIKGEIMEEAKENRGQRGKA